jgi:group I intron endonuclease
MNIINNKIYVGYTQTSLYRRIISHYALSKKNTSSNYFKSALSKYKKSDFIWFILFRSISLNDLKDKEQFFIELFKSNNRLFGYNLSSGGEQCYFNEEVKNKISEKAKNRGLKGEQNPFYGKHHTLEQRNKWSENRKGVVHNPEYKHTEETKKKLSKIKKEICKKQEVINNMSLAQKSKHITCINTGISFRSIGEASRNLKINKSTIQAHLKGKLKSAKGYFFIYD